MKAMMIERIEAVDDAASLERLISVANEILDTPNESYTLTEADWAAVREGRAQIARGESMNGDEAFAYLHKKLAETLK